MHGGTLRAVQTPEGVALELRLPVAANVTPTLPPPASETVDRTKRRILVVDDDARLCRALERVLRSQLDVVTAVGGSAALELLARDGGFDAVLCDITMPDLDGPGVLRRASELRPGIDKRFLFMTGGVFSAGLRDAVAGQGVTVLIKPVDAVELLRAIDGLARPAARSAAGD
jgi:CheY-like chemotaxis protein